MNPHLQLLQDISLRDGEECAFRGLVTLPPYGQADILVTNSRILFVSHQSSGGVQLNYRSIALHAISSTDDGRKYIFVQLISDEPNDESTETDDDIIEIYPSDLTSVEPMFKALNEMSALHPDSEPEDQTEESEHEGND
jgi:hypothetical protein